MGQVEIIALSALLLACFGVAGALFYLLYRIPDMSFRFAYYGVAFFIILLGCLQICGLFGLWITVEPVMLLFECATAVSGLVSALMLLVSLPKILALSSGRRAAHLHSLKLEQACEELGVAVEKGGERVRTALSAIRTPTQNLLQRNPSAEDRKELERIQQNADSLLRALDDYFAKNPSEN
jgi:hypothetical protein